MNTRHMSLATEELREIHSYLVNNGFSEYRMFQYSRLSKFGFTIWNFNINFDLDHGTVTMDVKNPLTTDNIFVIRKTVTASVSEIQTELDKMEAQLSQK